MILTGSAARRARMEYALILAVAAVAFLGLRALLAQMPLERDEGGYAYIAQRLLVGDVPYRDMLENKPPGIFFLFAVPIYFFGPSVLAIRLLAFAWTAATAAFLYLVARRVAGRLAAAFSVAVFSVIMVDPSWLAMTANTEVFMLLPMTAAVWCALRAVDQRQRGYWLAAGACVMAAWWFKQVSITNVGVLAAIALTGGARQATGRSFKSRLADTAAFLCGIAAMAAPVVGYFFARDAWASFIEGAWLQGMNAAQLVSPAEGLSILVRKLGEQAATFWLVWLLAVAGLWRYHRVVPRATWFAAVWLLCSLAGASIGLHFREHYFIQLAPALALAAGMGLDRLVRRLEPRHGCAGRLVLSGALTACLVAPLLVIHFPLFLLAPPREQIYRLYCGNPFDVSDEIAAYLRRNSQPQDSILIFGSEGQILFLSERRSATRYVFFYPLMRDFADAGARQQEALCEIERAQPRFVVMTENHCSLLATPRTPSTLRDAVSTMLKQDYELDGVRIVTSRFSRMIYGKSAKNCFDDYVRSGRNFGQDMLIFARRDAAAGNALAMAPVGARVRR